MILSFNAIASFNITYLSHEPTVNMANSSGALVRVDGIPGVVDLKYRPRRISMFPLSYKDRALLRCMERERRRLIETENVVEPTNVEAAPEASKATQTKITYCAHQCPDHPEVFEPSGGGGKKGKDKGKGKGEPQSKKGKAAKTKKDMDSDEEEQSSSEDDDEKITKGKSKGKGENSKDTKAGKGDKGKKGGKETVADPSLPYPWSSPNFAKLMGRESFSKEDGKEQSGLAKGPTIQDRIEQARRDDEEYALQIMTKNALYSREDLLKWLAERDAARLNKFADLEQELGVTNAGIHRAHNPQRHSFDFNSTPGHRRRVSFADSLPGLPPRFATQSHAGSDHGSSPGQIHNGPKRPVVVQYDENGHLCLPDGTRVIIPQTQGVTPAIPAIPTVQSVNAYPTQAPPAQGHLNHPVHAWNNQQMPTQTMHSGNAMQNDAWQHAPRIQNQAMQNSAWQRTPQMPNQAMPNVGPSHNNAPPTPWEGSRSNHGNPNDQNVGDQQGWQPVTNNNGVPIDPGDDDHMSNQDGWHHQPGPPNGNGRPQTNRFFNMEDAFATSSNGNDQGNQGNNVSKETKDYRLKQILG